MQYILILNDQIKNKLTINFLKCKLLHFHNDKKVYH